MASVSPGIKCNSKPPIPKNKPKLVLSKANPEKPVKLDEAHDDRKGESDPLYSEIGDVSEDQKKVEASDPISATQKSWKSNSDLSDDVKIAKDNKAHEPVQYAVVHKTKSLSGVEDDASGSKSAELSGKGTSHDIHKIDMYKYDFVRVHKAHTNQIISLDLKKRVMNVDLSAHKNGSEFIKVYNMYSPMISVTSVSNRKKSDLDDRIKKRLLYCAHDTDDGVDIVHLKNVKSAIDSYIYPDSQISPGNKIEGHVTSIPNLASAREPTTPKSSIMAPITYFENCLASSADASTTKVSTRDSVISSAPPVPEQRQSIINDVKDEKFQDTETITDGDEEQTDMVPPYAISKRRDLSQLDQNGNLESRKVEIVSDNEDMSPYATSHVKHDETDEDDYETIGGPLSETPLIYTVKKQTFNFICQFEKAIIDVEFKQAAENREIDVTFKTEEALNDFIDIYQRVGPELWVEGIKTDSIKDISELKNKVESDFQCIFSQPDPEKNVVEVLCKKSDLEMMKSALDKYGPGDINYIYEMAKEPEAVSLMKIEDVPVIPPSGFTVQEKKVYLHIADITKMRVDAIVNAANESLHHGGGVAKAIANAGGKKFSKVCQDYIMKHGKLKVTDIAKTEAGNLPCSKVLHAVGPRWDKSRQDQCIERLNTTFRNILECAEQYESIAIPPVSSGKFGVPIDHVVSAMTQALTQSLPNTQWCTIHIVDVREDVLKPLKSAIEATARMEPIPKEQVDEAIKQVLGSAAGQPVIPKKKIREKFSAFFSKSSQHQK